jgi:uncharacterized repeat protein (TIGR02543 family)
MAAIKAVACPATGVCYADGEKSVVDRSLSSAAPTRTTASVTPTTTTLGHSVKYSATVRATAGIPTGTVSFSVGATKLCTATLTGGSASCTATNAPAGADIVTATYLGNSTFSSSSGTAKLTDAVTLYVDGTNGTVTTGCTSPGTGACQTLQEGVTAAETYTDTDVTLEVAAGTYAEHDTITAKSLSSLTIQGAGTHATTVTGTKSGRPLTVEGGTVAISGFTITNGHATTGGGVFNDGSATLTDDTVTNDSTPPGGKGGGVLNDGTATLTDDTLSGDTAGDYGGGFMNTAGTATLTDDNISGDTTLNDPGDGYFGGGIFNYGTATLTDDTISGDSSLNGGGVLNWDGSTATLTDDTVSTDSAYQGNGGGVYNLGTATLTDDTLSGDSAYGEQASENGGGVANFATATLTDDTVSTDSAWDYGGGVWNAGIATLTDDTLAGDTAFDPVEGVSPGSGGALYNYAATATLTDDTLSGDYSKVGGAVYNNDLLDGLYASDTEPTISNSILDNAACSSTISDGGYNVETGDSCAFGSTSVNTSTTINLATSLAANTSTGPLTLAIGPTSSAFEEVPAGACSVATDERADPRPGAAGQTKCDAGAFEWQGGTVAFNAENPGVGTVASMSGPDGSTITLPSAPSYPGYVFDGWFIASSGGSALTSPYTIPSGGITLYAQWTEKIVDAPPAFTADSPPTVATAGAVYPYTFVASGNPTPTYSLFGQPSWLSIGPTTGAVSGTVPVGTTGFSYSVKATNGITPPATVGPFAVTVHSAPAFTSDSPSTTAVASKSYAYTFVASGNPTPTYSLSGAPGWLSIDTSSGAVSGTVPSGTSSFSYTVKASNGVTPPASAGPYTVTVHSAPAFTTDSPPTSATAGASYPYTFVASGSPAPTYSLSGEPSWLSINASSGALSGTVPAGTTSFGYKVLATNGITPAASVGPFDVNVPEAPHFTTDSPSTSAVVDTSYAYTFAASGNPAPTFSLSGAPGWLSVSTTTGAVSGTPPSGTTSFSYTVKASNGVTPMAAAGPFNVTVSAVPATPTGVTATAGVSSAKVTWTVPATGGTPTSFVVHASPSVAAETVGGSATSATVGGLTPGVSYTFTVTAANTAGDSASSSASNPVVPTSVAAQGSDTNAGANPSATTSTSGTPPVKVTATGSGTGTLTVATYPSDPVAGLSAGATYFDVAVTPNNSFSTVSFSVCGLSSGQGISWWNPTAQAWQTVSDATAVNAQGCSTVTVTSTTSPNLTQLYGTVFAVTKATAGYDMVGKDGGVFVFSPPGTTGGFYGSLPGLGVKVNDIVGMVPTSTDQGYFLVGSDGGVFALGNAPFLGSLPGLGVTPSQPITGIVAANGDKGYFLVGRDGGVFAFGTVPFLGSLPGKGISVDNIIGIASTPSGNGYWLVSATGTVYAFGAAQALGTAKGTSSPVSAIAGTPTGGGYWITTQNGAVHAFGNAKSFSTLPALGVTPALPVIGIVHTADTAGYWLIGADGGIFAFGDAGFVGSLPGLTVHVTDVVGAVPTSS